MSWWLTHELNFMFLNVRMYRIALAVSVLVLKRAEVLNESHPSEHMIEVNGR